MNKPVVSVFIPAYSNPVYTKKTLQSIVEQDYRPIELLFLDDCSPTPLEPMVDEFRKYEGDDFIIRFIRHPVNLPGVGVDNMIFGFDNCTGKYVVNMPHDDWWTDKRFLSEAVDLMERNPECHLCVANSFVENTDGLKMIQLPLSMKNRDAWQILPGDAYINLLGADNIGYQAWSAIVFNLPLSRSMGAFHYPFTLSAAESTNFGEVILDSFAFQFLLSSIGSVAITEKVIGVRGRPETAECNRSFAKERGKKFKGCGTAFVVYYSLYKADLNGKYAQAVKRRARKTIFHFPIAKINFKILKHFNYAIDACYLMLLSYLFGFIFYPRNYYWRLLRAIRDGEVSQLIAKYMKARGF